MNTPHSTPKNALARVFPAFSKPPISLDTGRDQSLASGHSQPILEPGAPPTNRLNRQLLPTVKSLDAAVSNEAAKPRIGQICFANCLPVYLPLLRQHVQLDASMVFDTPVALNHLLDAGELHMGSVSSFHYLSRANLTLSPGISISCTGEVGSVLFFSKCEPAHLRDQRIIVSAHSATSVNLLKVLMIEEYGFIPEMVADPRPDLESSEYAAALVIGDRALEVDSGWSQLYLRIDLGAWWHQRYQLPMVFGVWAARTDWVGANQARFSQINAGLKEAKSLGLGRRWKDTLYEARRRTGLSLSRLERYYKQELNFDFGDSHRQGLVLYESLLRSHRLL